MKTSPIALSILAGLSLPGAALAGELLPLQAEILSVGHYTAAVYYTAADDRYDVVTTVAPNGRTDGAPMRFTGSLGYGETQTISVGEFGTRSAPDAIALTHDGDHLVVTVLPSELTMR